MKSTRLSKISLTRAAPGNNLSMAITRNDAGGARLWTFGGTPANRSIAKQIQSLVEIRRVDAIGLDLKTPIDPRELSADLLQGISIFLMKKSRILQSRSNLANARRLRCCCSRLLGILETITTFDQHFGALSNGGDVCLALNTNNTAP